MRRGIYIMANDRFLHYAVALLNSIRLHDPTVEVIFIPYDSNYLQTFELLKNRFGVTLYPDLSWIEKISSNVERIFGEKIFARPNQFRKLLCWFGPLEEFLYIDTDIVVFDRIAKHLDYLSSADFVVNDWQHKRGISDVFSPSILQAKVFSDNELEGVFNAGFWAARKGLITEEILYSCFRECAQNMEYFDFSKKTSDQPIFNFLILKSISRRLNLTQLNPPSAGSWAGSPHFKVDGHRLFDPNHKQFLSYLHWAGIKIERGAPYWDIWNYYYQLKLA